MHDASMYKIYIRLHTLSRLSSRTSPTSPGFPSAGYGLLVVWADPKRDQQPTLKGVDDLVCWDVPYVLSLGREEWSCCFSHVHLGVCQIGDPQNPWFCMGACVFELPIIGVAVKGTQKDNPPISRNQQAHTAYGGSKNLARFRARFLRGDSEGPAAVRPGEPGGQ